MICAFRLGSIVAGRLGCDLRQCYFNTPFHPVQLLRIYIAAVRSPTTSNAIVLFIFMFKISTWLVSFCKW